MKRGWIRSVAATGVLTIVLGGPFLAADDAKENPIDRIVGFYKVSSNDAAGEQITGDAIIRKDGTATVYYKHAATGRIYSMTSVSITAQDDLYTIVLRGALPPQSAQCLKNWPRKPNSDVEVFSLPKQIKRAFDLPTLELPSDAEVTVTTSGESGTFASVGPQKRASADEVELHLRYHPQSMVYSLLSGTWRVYVDPLTWRDANDADRGGCLGRDPKDQNICAIAGNEYWAPITSPCRLQFFAKCVGNLRKIDNLYAGVPSVVEAAFDDPQDEETKTVKVTWGKQSRELKMFRREDDHRIFTSDTFIPSDPAVRAGGSPARQGGKEGN